MPEAISEPREELNENAPRISTVKIDQEKIGMVIGKGGETIRSLEADYDVQIDIEEDGTILVYATEGTKAEAAIAAIKGLTKEPEVGDTYTGAVVKTTDFGAFVELKKGTDGLLHVSNVGPGPGRPHRGRDRPRRHAGRGRPGGRQGARPHRPQAGRQARERRARQPEELVERAKDAPPRERSERPRATATAAAAAAAAAAATAAAPRRRLGDDRGRREPRPVVSVAHDEPDRIASAPTAGRRVSGERARAEPRRCAAAPSAAPAASDSSRAGFPATSRAAGASKFAARVRVRSRSGDRSSSDAAHERRSSASSYLSRAMSERDARERRSLHDAAPAARRRFAGGRAGAAAAAPRRR